MKKMRIVIKIGGSLLFDDYGPIVAIIKNFVNVLKRIKKRHQIILVVGGGKFVRNYMKRAKALKISNKNLEWIAIEILKSNVRLFSYLLDLKPIFDLNEINEKTEGVLAGICPGRSTDANAAIAAKAMRADMLIKVTNVDGIYDKDPNIFKDAKKIDRISFNELMKFAKRGKPGSYGILDKLAIETIVKNKIRTFVISGENPKNIIKVINGKNIGTEISD
ncbi:MAG: UMP kinase [Candidatus Aenigmatarchaeota archaeon]